MNENSEALPKRQAKQVIVVNKRLDMPVGKLAAQVAHASLGALLSCSAPVGYGVLGIPVLENSPQKQWLEEKFTKVVVYVRSEEKLLELYRKAKESQLPCALIQDCGSTFFSSPTHTCVGIGPAWPEDFVGLTDKLQLL